MNTIILPTLIDPKASTVAGNLGIPDGPGEDQLTRNLHDIRYDPGSEDVVTVRYPVYPFTSPNGSVHLTLTVTAQVNNSSSALRVRLRRAALKGGTHTMADMTLTIQRGTQEKIVTTGGHILDFEKYVYWVEVQFSGPSPIRLFTVKVATGLG